MKATKILTGVVAISLFTFSCNNIKRDKDNSEPEKKVEVPDTLFFVAYRDVHRIDTIPLTPVGTPAGIPMHLVLTNKGKCEIGDIVFQLTNSVSVNGKVYNSIETTETIREGETIFLSRHFKRDHEITRQMKYLRPIEQSLIIKSYSYRCLCNNKVVEVNDGFGLRDREEKSIELNCK